jgi:uncharacterized protein (DUF2126 family)/transglutaminase-like putative cysteine protease
MGNLVALHHRTQYQYERAVSLGPQVIQLRPAPHCRTPITEYSLQVSPANHILHWQFDPLGNHLARVIFPEKTDTLAVEVNLIADLTPYNPFGFFVEPGFETFPFTYPAGLARDLEPYRVLDEMGPKLETFLATLPRGSQPTVDFLVDLNRRVANAVGYTTRLEHGVQSCEETLTGLTGSCRDSAWLLVQVFRRLGVAARFVSGYLIQLVADDPSQGGPTVDNADLHAWAEVYLPGAGWIGLDPTSGLLTAEGHIPLVCTPTAQQAAPISGTAEPADVDFSFEMSVQRIGHAASIPKQKTTPNAHGRPQKRLPETNIVNPYSETEWAAVRAAAHAIDRSIAEQDIRLTMGGEPTYVGTDDPESLQWSVAALGAAKRTAGLALLRSLREKTAPGGLLHFGQGKWYPGEELPRWAFHCVSRRDGVAVWENVELFTLEDEDRKYGLADALRLMTALTRRLGVQAKDIVPGYDSADTVEPAGYVLPLRRRQPNGALAWSSQLWFERPERLLLSYGDSPIGYRIPVDAMPFVAPDELAYDWLEGVTPEDDQPLTEKVKLPTHPARMPERFGQEPERDPLPPLSSTAETATELIRPSLCVQARDGRLHVFVPYVAVLADYLDLVAGIEDTAAHLGVKIWIEGYAAPMDRRAVVYSLTPDPGVLEVNLPPTDNWNALEELNKTLADEAAKNRLVAGKFAYDGTHLATGGGYHIVLGAKTVPDSPVLRRPDLLRSMVAFWQNHPSLSYLFAGMYVGPTSQYPRVDEARSDALYELEVSFSQLPKECPPYIVDGLFRNLLVDVTGNTHRAEFCIDKMYPPEGQGLRAGLLELRAFEMAPHYRMNLTQMLLVRAAVCAFWKQPFTGELLRWGAALHDRFMLPHFIRQDFGGVLEYLRDAGFGLDEAWFEPQLEFRFPRIGTMSVDGVAFELRQALEPWNVLAEETSSGRTGRSVDSSLERLQVMVTGAAEGRYVVACNGRRVPLHPTGPDGEWIAGIRYRARRLSAALHPTVPVHTPLVFDIIDTQTERSIGRCTYYAGRPDGELYPDRPADAAEAKTRRMERFQVSAAPADGVQVPAEEINPVFPMTLDLRWPAPGGFGETA